MSVSPLRNQAPVGPARRTRSSGEVPFCPLTKVQEIQSKNGLRLKKFSRGSSKVRQQCFVEGDSGDSGDS